MPQAKTTGNENLTKPGPFSPSTAAEICFNVGVTAKLDPSQPKPASLKFTIYSNAMLLGYAYVSPDEPNPKAAALRLGARFGANEAWHGTPSNVQPCSYLCGS